MMKNSTIIKMIVMVGVFFAAFTFAGTNVYAAEEFENDGFTFVFDEENPNYVWIKSWTNKTNEPADLSIPVIVSDPSDEYWYHDVIGICDNAFKNQNVRNITLDGYIQTIGEGAFSGNPIESVTIPSSCSKIKKNAFADCNSLQFVFFENDSVTIENGAFVSGVKLIASEGSTAQIYAQSNNNAFGNIDKVIKKISVSVSSFTIPKYGDKVIAPTFSISYTEPSAAEDYIELSADCGWYDDFPNGYHYSDDENIERYGKNFSLKVKFNPDNYPAKYTFEGTKVYFNGQQVNGYDYSDANYLTAGLLFDVDKPATVNLCETNMDRTGKGTVSFDASTYETYITKSFAAKKNIVIHAKPDENSVFIGWKRSDDNDFISTAADYSITAPDSGEDITYYAYFERKFSATGSVNDSVNYTFDEVTGTMTFIPTKDDGNGGKTGKLSGFSYNSDSPDRSPLYYSTQVRHVVINPGITEIGEWFGYNTRYLETVSIPSTVTYIEERAFEDTKLGEFLVASENEKFKSQNGSLLSKDGTRFIKYASTVDGLDFITPDGVTLISGHSFENAVLGTITLKGDGLSVGDYAFCCEYKHIIISEGVKKLGNYSDSPLEDTVITLPSSLEYIGNQGIITGAKLKEIKVAEGNENYESIDGILYSIFDDGLRLYKYPSAKTDTSYTTPENVTRVEWCSIYGVEALKDITLTANVEFIDGYAICYLNDATLTILNSNCSIRDNSASAIYQNVNLTMKGEKGSTAYSYANKKGITFICIGGDSGKLDAPTNLRWDGTVAKWDAIEGARYYIRFYKNEDGSWYHMSSQDITITDGSCELDFQSVMWYKDAGYKFEIRAGKVGYDDSDWIESPVTGGLFNRGTFDAKIDGDTICAPFDIGNIGYDWISYYISFCDDSDNQLYSAWRNAASKDEYPNMREILASESAPYGKYRVYIYKRIDYAGWTVDIADPNNYVVYDYQSIPKINKVELTIPNPVNGSLATCIDNLKVKTFCGDTVLNGLTKDTQYYNNCYQYRDDEYSSWTSFGYYDALIENGKYQYAYFIVLDILNGYELKDDFKLYINGKEEGTSIVNRTASFISVRYEFPVGTKAYTYIKNINITGDYAKPVVGEDIKDPENVQATEDGLIVKNAYWIEKENSEWKTIKVSGKFEADKEYAIYVELKTDEENDYRLEQPGLDSYKIFGDDEAKCEYYTFSGASFIKIIGKPDAAPTPTATPTTDVDASPTPASTPASTDPSVSPSPAVPSASPEVTATPEPVGTTLTDTKGKAKYKVISAGKTDSADPSKNELPVVSYTGTTNKKAKKITVPDTVTLNGLVYKVETIGAGALKKNKKITTVTIGKNVKVIEKNAFAGCPKLKTVNCKSKVLYKIGANAFKDDSKLNKIILKTKLLKKKNVGKNAIKGTSKKLKIYTPKEVKKSYQKIFKAKGNKKVKTK